MRSLRFAIPLAALALIGGCSRGPEVRPDDALNTDLALAAQAHPYQAQQFVSPSEQQPAAGYGVARQYAAAPRADAPVARRRAARSTVRRSSSRSSGGSSRASSEGTYYPSVPSAPSEPIRNTKRDAAIGAAAGAIIGATTSRDRVKGGLIGAAAGGILGGIIGHTVDVRRP
ncbi:MAG: glycine zipper 2TM domain-containing protein [Gemmatimonadaceae bacterium]|nr:glycine zipper 2TM domain-containing protein [Gemmatimonadaceae bacterium]